MMALSIVIEMVIAIMILVVLIVMAMAIHRPENYDGMKWPRRKIVELFP